MNGTANTEYEKTAVATAVEDLTQVVSAPGVEATAMSANVECPVCRTQNPPSETYCIDCGFLLSEKPEEVEPLPEQPSFGSLKTPDGAREFALKLGENTVGRENADILLTHNSVSRMHAKITVEEGRALVEDIGSTNGTCVNGARIKPNIPTELKDGAELLFGSTALIYKSPSPQPSPQVEGEQGEGGDLAEPKAEDVEAAEGEAAAEPQQPEPRAQLVSKDGVLAFDLVEGEYKIGRRQGENDLVVPDPYASRRHADLTVSESAIYITDVGSSSGTLVNGVRIQPNTPCELHPGDEITIGRIVLVLEGA